MATLEGALPTGLDQMHAVAYAMNVVRKLKCEDEAIKKEYGDGLTYVENDKTKIFPCPTPRPGDVKYPCISGNCAMDETLCVAQSVDPYNEDGTPVIPKPTKPYLEWHPDSTNPSEGKCVFGNFPLMQWCKYPAQRAKKSIHGRTDVPPFRYDPTTGNCFVTSPYCDWMEVSYKLDDGVPTCYTHGAQKFFEKYFIGRTLLREIKQKIFEEFEKSPPPPRITKIIDPKIMKSYKKIGPDFGGPGIHLYTITWKDDAVKHDTNAFGSTVGFLSREIKKEYPNLITKKNGLEWLTIDVEDAKNDKNLKRIYIVSTSGIWVLKTIASMLETLKSFQT